MEQGPLAQPSQATSKPVATKQPRGLQPPISSRVGTHGRCRWPIQGRVQVVVSAVVSLTRRRFVAQPIRLR
eukprot:7724292-Lingulodinium_polyedra.AAC.1